MADMEWSELHKQCKSCVKLQCYYAIVTGNYQYYCDRIIGISNNDGNCDKYVADMQAVITRQDEKNSFLGRIIYEME